MRRLLPLILAACGLGGATGGGNAELPVSGAGPYRKLTDFEGETGLEEPYLVSDNASDLSDPSGIEVAGVLRVYYSRSAVEIWRVDVAPSFTTAATEPELALGADQPWEQGGVRAPAVIAAVGRLAMFYQGAAGGIGRADSFDGGASWVKQGLALPDIADAAEPSVVFAGDTLFLYHTRLSEPGVFVATSPDGQTWQEHPVPVLAADVGAPHAAGGLGEAGELHIAIVYSARSADGSFAIGYAGSSDGVTFESRPASILEPRAPSELAPSLVLEPTRGILLFAQPRAQRTAVAAATAP